MPEWGRNGVHIASQRRGKAFKNVPLGALQAFVSFEQLYGHFCPYNRYYDNNLQSSSVSRIQLLLLIVLQFLYLLLHGSVSISNLCLPTE